MLAIVVFSLSLVLTGLTDWLAPLDFPKLKGDEKTRLEETRANSNWLDGSLARRIENDQRLRSPVRRWLLPGYGWFLYTRLREAKNLYIGKGGWLFLPAKARAPGDARQTADLAVHCLASLQRMLSQHGTRLVVAPIPRKSVLLEALLPHGVDPNRRVEERLSEGLLAAGIPNANLLAVFEQADTEEMYFFADTHWTPAAEILAAEEIARVAGIYLPPDQRDTELRKSDKIQAGFNLYSWLGASDTPSVAAYLKSHVRYRYEVYPMGSDAPLPRANPAGPCRIGLAGTSFVAHRAMRVLLRHFSGEEVWNAGQGGIGPMRPLRKYLKSLGGDSWPELLILEFPVDQIIGEVGLTEALRVCADWTSPGEVLGPSWAEWRSDTAREDGAQGWTRLASLPAGQVAHSGDGVLSILLERKLSAGETRLEKVPMRLQLGEECFDFTWERGERTIALPLVSINPNSGGLSLSCDSSHPPKLTSIQIAQTTPLGALAEATLRPRKSGIEGLNFRFDGPLVIPEQGVLQVLGAPWPPNEAVTIEIGVDGSGRAPRSFVFDSLSPGAPVVLGLQAWAGQELRGLHVRTTRELPHASAIKIQLMSPRK